MPTSPAIARAVHFGARVLTLDEPSAALGVKQATHVLRIVNEAERRWLAGVFIIQMVIHVMAMGDHFVVLIRGTIASDVRKGEKIRLRRPQGRKNRARRSPTSWRAAPRWPVLRPKSTATCPNPPDIAIRGHSQNLRRFYCPGPAENNANAAAEPATACGGALRSTDASRADPAMNAVLTATSPDTHSHLIERDTGRQGGALRKAGRSVAGRALAAR